MQADKQIPRMSILWLLLVQLVVIIPHVQRLSFWMIAIWLLCAFWRLAMFRGTANYPGFFLRTLVVLLGTIGIAVSFGHQGALDIAVAALIFAFSLKLIEVKKRRDLFLLLYLAFFVIAASFLYSQSLFLVLYQLFAVVVVLSGLSATQSASAQLQISHSLRLSSKLIVQAIPLLLLLFFVFPRLSPIWAVSDSSLKSRTGMSDSMSVGYVSELAQSTELVFSVDFIGEPPEQSALYWRGMTYENFDGSTWTRGAGSEAIVETNNGRLKRPLTTTPFITSGQPIHYEVSMPASGANWLFMLPVAEVVNKKNHANLGLALTSDFNYETKQEAKGLTLWNVSSYLDYVAEPELSYDRIQQLTALPEGFNPKTRDFARRMALEVTYYQTQRADDFAQQIWHFFNREKFYYTLKPDVVGRHTVDDFLFVTRNGFCEYYANAATMLFRAVGIPARVVAGYQGGEINAVNQLLQVRQLDAHAWVEYWQRGEGWQRFDPTAAVAPERIDYGLNEALTSSNRNELAFYNPIMLNNLAWYKGFQQRLDAVNLAWQRAFVNFDSDKQQSLLSDWLGELTHIKLSVAMLVAMCVTLAAIAFVTLRRRRIDLRSPEDKLYDLFCSRLAKLGLPRDKGEAPASYAVRVSIALPDLAEEVGQITKLYEQLVFQELTQKSLSISFSRKVKAFRPKVQKVDVKAIQA